MSSASQVSRPRVSRGFIDDNHMSISFHLKDDEGELFHSICIRNFENATKQKNCDCDRDWMDKLELGSDVNLNDTYNDPEGELATGRFINIRNKILDVVPRVHVRGREATARRHAPTEDSAITHVPLVCGQLEKFTFGVRWNDLCKWLNLRQGRLAEIIDNMDIRNKQQRCVFPFEKTDKGQKSQIVPLDMIPDVLNMFGDPSEIKSHHENKFSISNFAAELSHLVLQRTTKLNIQGLGYARVAAFAEKMDLMSFLRTVSYEKIIHDIDDHHRALSIIQRENIALRKTARELVRSTKLIINRNKQMAAQMGLLMDIMQDHAAALNIMGGLSEPEFIAPLPGATLATCSRYHRSSVKRPENPISGEQFVKILRSVAAMVGREGPRADDIEQVYLDTLTTTRVTSDNPERVDGQWYKFFTLTRALTGEENPTMETILDTFQRTLRKRKHQPGAEDEDGDGDGYEDEGEEDGVQPEQHPSPKRRKRNADA